MQRTERPLSESERRALRAQLTQAERQYRRRFDVWLKCRGHRLAPRRCLPAALRITLPDAEHGAVLSPEDATRVLAVGDANAAA
jgi:hypothetical protein